MDDQQQKKQSLTWNGFLSVLKSKAEKSGSDSSKVISELYKYTAGEPIDGKSTNFEQLRTRVRELSEEFGLGLQIGDINRIYQTAPLSTAERVEPRETEEEFRKESRRESTSSGGPMRDLVNHDKYETDILDKLHEEHTERAIDELDAFRNQLAQDTRLSDQQKADILANKFGEILTRNQTPEQAIAAHHDLLEQQLRQQAEALRVSGDIRGHQQQIAAALEVNRRKNGLLKERAIEDATALGQGFQDIVDVLQRNGRLTQEQLIRLSRGRLTMGLEGRGRDGQLRDIHDWVQKFRFYNTKDAQDALLRQLFTRQYRDIRGDLRPIFFKHGLVGEKTLTRAQRRGFLGYQQVLIQRRYQLRLPTVTFSRKLYWQMMSSPQFISYANDDYSQFNSPGSFGFSFNPLTWYNRFQNGMDMIDFFGGFGGGAEAGGALAGAGGGGAAAAGGAGVVAGGAAAEAGAAGAGAAAATSEVWVPVLLIILAVVVIVLLLVVLVVLIIKDSPQPENSTDNSNNGTPIPGLAITIDTAPSNKFQYNNGDTISYVIDVKYSGTEDILISDKIPSNALPSPTGLTGIYTYQTNAVVWDLVANTPLSDSTTSTKHYKFTISLLPTQKDTIVSNTVVGTYSVVTGTPTPTPTPIPPEKAGKLPSE